MSADADFSKRIRQFVDDEHAESLIREYFKVRENGSPLYSGSRFEEFGDGGDQPAISNRFTPEDLIAITCLGVNVPGGTALRILGQDSAKLQTMLEKVPNAVDLWDVDPEVVIDGSPADDLWQVLKSYYGVGWVVAGKLMSRKRPRLIPVYDKVVRSALEVPTNFWIELRAALVDDESLRDRLSQLRVEAGSVRVSNLRILDVVIWMRNFGFREAEDERLRALAPL